MNEITLSMALFRVKELEAETKKLKEENEKLRNTIEKRTTAYIKAYIQQD